MTRCEITRDDLERSGNLCPLCNQGPAEHLAERGVSAASPLRSVPKRSGVTDGRQDLHDDVLVKLPRENWASILLAMSWDLPALGDHSADGDAAREHSERCFNSMGAIRAALGLRIVSHTIKAIGGRS